MSKGKIVTGKATVRPHASFKKADPEKKETKINPEPPMNGWQFTNNLMNNLINFMTTLPGMIIVITTIYAIVAILTGQKF